jgi:hypothetical protein
MRLKELIRVVCRSIEGLRLSVGAGFSSSFFMLIVSEFISIDTENRM